VPRIAEIVGKERFAVAHGKDRMNKDLRQRLWHGYAAHSGLGGKKEEKGDGVVRSVDPGFRPDRLPPTGYFLP